MMNLTNVTNSIVQVFGDMRSKLVTQQQETTMNASMRRGGKKQKGSKNLNGGDTFEVKPNMNDPAFSINDAFSAQKLKNECMNDLEKDIFNSRNRIFVVDGKLPTYTPPALDALQAQEKQLAEELARNANMPPPAAPVQVGGRRKTHKQPFPKRLRQYNLLKRLSQKRAKTFKKNRR